MNFGALRGRFFRQNADLSYPDLPPVPEGKIPRRIVIDAHGLAFAEFGKQVMFTCPDNVRIFSYTFPGMTTNTYDDVYIDICENKKHLINNLVTIIYTPGDTVNDIILNVLKPLDNGKQPFYKICDGDIDILSNVNDKLPDNLRTSSTHMIFSNLITYIKMDKDYFFDIHILSCQNLLSGTPDISNLEYLMDNLQLYNIPARLYTPEERAEQIVRGNKNIEPIFNFKRFDKVLGLSGFEQQFGKSVKFNLIKLNKDIKYLNLLIT